MADQADGLRRLVQDRGGVAVPVDSSAALRSAEGRRTVKARSLVFTSGKGGVGTSNLALNLAIALGEQGLAVVLVDADLGLANLDMLCGLTPARDLGDVLAGQATLAEATIEGPAGVTLIPGAHGIRTMLDRLTGAPERLASELATLERTADVILVDAGTGLGAGIATLAAAADEVAIVTTAEPTSLADAHAAIGRFRRLPGVRLRAVVNQAHSNAEAREVLDRLTMTSRQFLGAVVAPLGHVRFDPRVPLAVRSRRPFVLAAPRSAAARSVRRIAADWAGEVARSQVTAPDPAGRPARGDGRPGFFAALAARWALRRVAS